jgi:hypothetical protein
MTMRLKFYIKIILCTFFESASNGQNASGMVPFASHLLPVDVVGDLDPNASFTERKLHEALADLPLSIQRLLLAQKVRVLLAESMHVVMKERPDLTPESVVNLLNYAFCEGAYNSEARTVMALQLRNNNPRMVPANQPRALLHEIGHAYDELSDLRAKAQRLSDTPEFIALYQQELAALDEQAKQQMQNSNASLNFNLTNLKNPEIQDAINRREIFAELFAVVNSPLDTPSVFRFGKLAHLIRALIEREPVTSKDMDRPPAPAT